jgi:large subunit ribosomal protein L9
MASLSMAYAILGFAVLHAITRGIATRPFVLGGVYAAVIVLFWPALALTLLGLADTAFDIRGRVAGRAARRIREPTHPIHQTDLWRKTMEVILLERVAKLGQMGEVVRVKDGFARNYLLPKGRRARNASQQVEVRNHEGRVAGAEPRRQGRGREGRRSSSTVRVSVLRQASESGQLYGSVSPRDLAALMSDGGFPVSRSQIALNVPIKSIGVHKVPVVLHPSLK